MGWAFSYERGTSGRCGFNKPLDGEVTKSVDATPYTFVLIPLKPRDE